MKYESAARALRTLRILLAIMTVAVCILLCWQAIDIYLAGNRPENFRSPGVRIEPVYSRETVIRHLQSIAPFLYLYLAMIALGLILQAACAKKTAAAPRVKKTGSTPLPENAPQEKPAPHKKARSVRYLILYAIALLLILAGIRNGGLRDVFVKAIHICTECIGLG